METTTVKNQTFKGEIEHSDNPYAIAKPKTPNKVGFTLEQLDTFVPHTQHQPSLFDLKSGRSSFSKPNDPKVASPSNSRSYLEEDLTPGSPMRKRAEPHRESKLLRQNLKRAQNNDF